MKANDAKIDMRRLRAYCDGVRGFAHGETEPPAKMTDKGRTLWWTGYLHARTQHRLSHLCNRRFAFP